MLEGVLHTRDIQGPKKEESQKDKIALVEPEIFKCEGMVERGLDTNHSMITDFIREDKMDSKKIVEMIFKLHDRLEDLQAQIYDLQNQNSTLVFVKGVDMRVSTKASADVLRSDGVDTGGVGENEDGLISGTGMTEYLACVLK
ncbi:40s ribosomal protein s5-1 [Hordeum vulgare]|nr:40s ribosomal protein s5-1 [Hordeum vulgare]